jgi:hypothetical protein
VDLGILGPLALERGPGLAREAIALSNRQELAGAAVYRKMRDR